MAASPDLPKKPPGPQRPSPIADYSGKIAFRSHSAGIEGETAYRIWGDLSLGKRPLICLHGGPGVPSVYMNPLSLIHQDYGIPVVMYDQIGCGQSTRFKDRKLDANLWTPYLFIDELDNVVHWLRREWKVTEFDILGHSWGGRLGALYAFRKQPAGLRKLVICASGTNTATLRPARAELRKELPAEVQDVLNRAEAGGQVDKDQVRQAAAYENGMFTCRCQPWPKELMDSFTSIQEDDTVFTTMTGFAMKGTLFHMPALLEGHLEKLTPDVCPGGMLIVSGQHDRTHDLTITRWFTDVKCNVKWVRLGLSSHFMIFEEPETFLKIVGKFLTRS